MVKLRKKKIHKIQLKRYRHKLKSTQYQLHIKQTKNNVFVNCGDINGNTKLVLTTASRGFSGRKEIKSFLANLITGGEFARRLRILRITKLLKIKLAGFGKNKKAILKGIVRNIKNLKTREIINSTPIPFNGCRRKKAARKRRRTKKR